MDFLKVKEQMLTMNQWADYYHADIMDGHFCKNITLSPDMVKAFASVADKPVDVHLMTTDPGDWIELVAKAGATFISPHAETINTDAFRILQLIAELLAHAFRVFRALAPTGTVAARALKAFFHGIDHFLVRIVRYFHTHPLSPSFLSDYS